MSICESPDFVYPMQADVFYPLVEQGIYGNVNKQWVLDRTFICNFNSVGAAGKEDITPNIQIKQELLLIGRSKTDPRVSARSENNSMTNVVISNLKDRNCNPIYMETAGPRVGKSTIFEIAAVEPIVGPFGSVEYYKLVIRRSENQAVDI